MLPTGMAKIMTLLAILKKMGGECDASDDRCNWLNWFCNDGPDRHATDTFNQAIELGYIRTSHDSDTDSSWAKLTAKGMAALVHAETNQA